MKTMRQKVVMLGIRRKCDNNGNGTLSFINKEYIVNNINYYLLLLLEDVYAQCLTEIVGHIESRRFVMVIDGHMC